MRNVLVLLLGLITTPAFAQQTPRADANVERARTHYFRAWENMRAEAFDVAAQEFGAAIELYPKYAPDYWATFFSDPDGIRLEVTNYRQERRDRHDHWEELTE